MTVVRIRINAELAARRRAQQRRFRQPFCGPWGVAQGVTPYRPGRWLAWSILAILVTLAAYLAWAALG